MTATEVVDADESDGASPQELLARHAWHLVAAATTLVIVVATARGVGAGYQPVSDNALVELRGRDVLTGDHPWLGTWSSASIGSGIDVNHPGPLQFDLAALPVRLLGGPAGVAVATAAVNIAMVWLAPWVVARFGGRAVALVVSLATAGLAWTLGSELLYDPWQPNALVLPFWVVLCTAWAVCADEVRLLPLLVGVASYVAQTHLGYVTIVPVIVAWAVGVVIWRRRRRGPERFADLRRPFTWSIVVAAVLWAQPLWEQFVGDGRGNLTRIVIAGTVGGDEFEPAAAEATGLATGVRILGAVLGLPPWWGRTGYDSSIPPSRWIETAGGRELDAPGLPTLGPALLGLLVVVAVVAMGWRSARRRRAGWLERGFTLLAVVAALAAVTVVIMPIDVLGLSAHKVRWLWPIGWFAACLCVVAAVTALAPQRRPPVLAGLGAIGLVALIATVPTHVQASGPVQLRETYRSVESIREQVADFLSSPAAPGAVTMDIGGVGFGEPYTLPIVAELARGGVDVVVDDRSLTRHLGSGRLAGDESGPVVSVRVGQDALVTPPGAELIAFHDGDLSPFSLDDVRDRAVAVFLSGSR